MSDSEETTNEPPDAAESEETTLLAEIAAHDEELAGSVGDLLDRIEMLEAEVESLEDDLDTAEERLQHTRADFKNYKERAKRRQEQIKDRATEDLIERLLEVRDNLGRALSDETENADSLREGVELTRKQFDRVFEEENVERIDPKPGTAVDATRHEVMMRVESDQPSDTIASVYRPGYEMVDKILRPAQVTVSEGSEDDSTAAADGAESDSTTEALEDGAKSQTGESAGTTDGDDTDAESGE